MAKKQAEKSDVIKLHDKPRDRTAEELRELGGELRQLADRIDMYAGSMADIGMAKIKPLTGEFYKGKKIILTFITAQIFGKIAKHANKVGVDIHDLFKKTI